MDVNLVPQPHNLEVRSGTVTWRSPLRVSVDDDWRWVADVFADDLARALGWPVAFVAANDPADLLLRHVSNCDDEAYRLTIDERATIEASTPAGLSYGLSVLRQLGPTSLFASGAFSVESIEMPRVIIEDGPRYAWRGVHLDLSRHFFDVATVCRLIDQMAVHRLNHLHLHLNDDQGWRIEIPSWPLLTRVGAHRGSSPIGHEDDGLDDNIAHGGFFNAGDIATIRKHAHRRFVRVVPEIDLPGHAQAVVAAYPSLGNTSEPLEVWTRWGVSEHVLNVGEEALRFAGDVVRYVASLFPESPVHIGGDECPTTEWSESEAARAVMAEHGFDDVAQLQGLFTTRLTELLLADGHEVIAWDEVMDSGVADGVVIAAWRSSSKAVQAAQSGLDVIMAPMQFLYFDWLNSDVADEPVALAPLPYFTPWEKVYRFSVIPPGLESSLHHHVRGAQVQLWTEYIATRDHLDYMAFPRIVAFSEVVWGTATSAEQFRPRLVAHLDRLEVMGVRYRPLDEAL